MWLSSRIILFLSISSFTYVCIDGKKVKVLSKRLKQPDPYHTKLVNQYYEVRKTWTTSNLGTIHFKNTSIYPHTGKKRKLFVILIWKHWERLKQRFVKKYKCQDPLAKCSVKNCKFTGDHNLIKTADAVLFWLFRTSTLPNIRDRNPKQRWIFFSEEAPTKTFSGTKKKLKLSSLANVFNWSMTYRSDSDVPVPYGRTVPYWNSVFRHDKLNYSNIASLVPYWDKKRRDVLITILMSHCFSHRMKYLRLMKIYIKVDLYGRCATKLKRRTRCPGYLNADCDVMSEYLFYLVLENSMCRQYMTEKLFYNAYSKGAIPIIRTPSLQDCIKVLPPHSFLHVDNYVNPSHLAAEIRMLSDNNEKLLEYHRWRNDFDVKNEHGFFGSTSLQLCRLCEAMNYNDQKVKIYSLDDLKLFLDERILCEPIWKYAVHANTVKFTRIIKKG